MRIDQTQTHANKQSSYADFNSKKALHMTRNANCLISPFHASQRS